MTDDKAFNLLMDFLSADLTGFLMRDHEGLTMSEAVLWLHNSEWFEKASNPDTQLYVQSAAYNYELLKHELKYGSLE